MGLEEQVKLALERIERKISKQRQLAQDAIRGILEKYDVLDRRVSEVRELLEKKINGHKKEKIQKVYLDATGPSGESSEDLMRTYNAKHPGMTSSRLFIEDRILYSRMKNAGLIKSLPKERKFMTDDELLEEALRKYSGLSGAELWREDRSMHYCLRGRKKGLVERFEKASLAVNPGKPKAPEKQPTAPPKTPKPRQEKPHNGNGKDNALNEYRSRYGGQTMEKLRRLNRGLYDRLIETGQISQLPSIYGEGLTFYHKNFEGLTKNELFVERPEYYELLKDQGLLEHIPAERAKVEIIPEPQGLTLEQRATATMPSPPKPRLEVRMAAPNPERKSQIQPAMPESKPTIPEHATGKYYLDAKPSSEKTKPLYINTDLVPLKIGPEGDYMLIRDSEVQDEDSARVRHINLGTVPGSSRKDPKSRLEVNPDDIKRLNLAKAYMPRKSMEHEFLSLETNAESVAEILKEAGVPPINYKGELRFPPGSIDIATMGDIQLKAVADLARPVIEKHGPFIDVIGVKEIAGKKFSITGVNSVVRQNNIGSITIGNKTLYNAFQVVMAYMK